MHVLFVNFSIYILNLTVTSNQNSIKRRSKCQNCGAAPSAASSKPGNLQHCSPLDCKMYIQWMASDYDMTSKHNHRIVLPVHRFAAVPSNQLHNITRRRCAQHYNKRDLGCLRVSHRPSPPMHTSRFACTLARVRSFARGLLNNRHNNHNNPLNGK